MGERKVLNKYYPSDFNPGKISRRRQPKNQQMKVRMMLPMSIRCGTCSNYIYKGTKFNSRKEEVIYETYLGIQIFMFYFKCTKCSAELTIKTDLPNSDYVVGSGASRNLACHCSLFQEVDKEKQKRNTEEMGDAMKSLVNRTLDSKREMDVLAALDEVKSMRSRQATISVDAMLEILQRSAEEKKLEEEDEALIKSLFGRVPREVVRRTDDDVLDDDEDLSQISTDNAETSNNNSKRRKVSEELPTKPTDHLTETSYNSKNEENKGYSRALGDGRFIFKSPSVRVSVVRKPSLASNSNGPAKHEEERKANVSSSGLMSLCQNYESDEDD
ncbi:splicing factor YJU2-like [Camellia sinensis]|uniref:splicing factor YJU2-like n=1 Tax=Camellia sinensis TaxID=4442 RepID=UPI001035CB43|nr:splicing factor YJU2-like [Camellia sinensis]